MNLGLYASNASQTISQSAHVGKGEVKPRVLVHFILLVTWLGLQEEEPQTAYSMYISWASHM